MGPQTSNDEYVVGNMLRCFSLIGSLDSKEQERVGKALRKSFGKDVKVVLPPPLLRSQLKVRTVPESQVEVVLDNASQNLSPHPNPRTTAEKAGIFLYRTLLLYAEDLIYRDRHDPRSYL